jgi:copper chaperone CopZ
MKKVIAIILLSMAFFEMKAQSKITSDTLATSTVCGTCKSILEEGLKFEKGVIRVVVLVEEKQIILKYRTDKTNLAALKMKVSQLGYQADDVPADPKGFEALPACCKKPHEK